MIIRSPKELALFVRNRRQELKLSQAELGNLVGLKQQTISAFENKPESTKLGTLFRILSSAETDIKLISKSEDFSKTEGWKEEW